MKRPTGNHRASRSLVAVGASLLALGVGNIVISANKLDQYAASPTALSVPHAAPPSFRELDERTNRQLLERLHRGLPSYEPRAAKRRFYAVVHVGGQILAACGATMLLLTAARARRGLRRGGRA